MTPWIWIMPGFGLIIPVRFIISISLLFISVKANVVSSYEGRDWEAVPGHRLLLATALINVSLAAISLILAGIRDEDALSYSLRWNCACCAIATRVFLLFPLSVFTIVVIAEHAAAGYFRMNEFVLAEVNLGLLLICFVVGIGRRGFVMHAANREGEQDVRTELVKQAGLPSANHSAASTPRSLPSIMCNSPDDAIQSLYLNPPTHKVYLGNLSTESLKQPGDPLYESLVMRSTRTGCSQDTFATRSCE